MGKDGEPTMERPSHPQQKFFKQHPHTPPPPPRSCLKKHRENLVAEKENRKLGGGGWGRFLREARVGCR